MPLNSAYPLYLSNKAVFANQDLAVTDTLKGPLVMALMLTIPAEGAGDND